MVVSYGLIGILAGISFYSSCSDLWMGGGMNKAGSGFFIWACRVWTEELCGVGGDALELSDVCAEGV